MAIVDEDQEVLLEMGKLANKVLLGKNRQKLMELLQEDNPDVPLPEVQAHRQAQELIKPLQTENAELRKEVDSLKVINQVQATRKETKTKLKVDDAMMDRIEKTMIEKGIAKHETAYEYIQQADRIATPQPVPSAGGRSGGPVSMPTMSESFIKNPQQGAREVAAATLAAIRSGKPLE